MFASIEAQKAAIQIRSYWPEIYSDVWNVFKNSAVATGTEVAFFRKLLTGMAASFTTFSRPGVNVTCRYHEVHQKPRVKVPSRHFECELGDLLVVVKYRLPNGTFEAKSILYQVKMCKRGQRTADIDQNQLTLLTEWPEFYFGKTASGSPQSFRLSPYEVEFGSYLIAQRNPAENDYLIPYLVLPPIQWWCGAVYGIAPTALRVQLDGPTKIDLDRVVEPCADVCMMVRHMMFESGEHHHHNESVRNFVDALYRYIGWAPDPPDEFEGFFRETNNEGIGFGVLELTVKFVEGERMKRPSSVRTAH
jgi:hypothetical protein